MTTSSRIIAAILFLTLVWGCDPSKKSKEQTETTFVYDFKQPTQKYELPKELKEISGITFYDENQLLCVQDEEGEVYVYDLAEEKVAKQHHFDQPGDYEDIVKVENDIYVLRSDGTLLSFKWDDKETLETDAALPGKNDVEGLAYDAVNKRLWLAVKEPSKKAAPKDEKPIYSFDLRRRAIYQERKMEEKQFRNVGLKGKAWKDFQPSGIAFHPKTGDIYLLSSVGHRLVIMNRAGVPLQNIELNPVTYRQPEGICFSPDGTLYISSEGAGGKGYILKFRPSQQ